MEHYFTDESGNELVPIWSLRANVYWCSLGASAEFIPNHAMNYIRHPPALFSATTPQSTITDLNFPIDTSLYNSAEHWLAWAPSAPLSDMENDPVRFAFNTQDIELVAEHAEVYGYDSDQEDSPSRVLASYFLDRVWVDRTLEITTKLHGMWAEVAVSSDFYGRGVWGGETGDVPSEVDTGFLSGIHNRQQRTASGAKRSIIAMMGCLNWFMSIKALENWNIPEEDRAFLRTLCLEERPKTGVIYYLTRDYHKANFMHLLINAVPVHYPWTAKERGDPRFLRLSPEYWNKYLVLRDQAGRSEVDITTMPNYEAWHPSFERYDWFFQDQKAGKRGDIVTEFKPHWEYHIIDFRLWGAHSVDNWHAIRAYSERFKASVSDSLTGTTCTFFRQNPLRVDEPSVEQVWPLEHAHELTDFANEERGEAVSEEEVFFRATSVEFGDMRDDVAGASEWEADEQRNRPQISLHEPGPSAFQMSENKLLGATPSVIGEFKTPFSSRQEAVEYIKGWAQGTTELEPRLSSKHTADWNLYWLGKDIHCLRDGNNSC
ncbi:hypothetical protein DFH09DRAFT_1087717 [Mycena vulgaris]|nr:hypothetical protein DFH09DRAFT_1087717 [Mycena vulgaris]